MDKRPIVAETTLHERMDCARSPLRSLLALLFSSYAKPTGQGQVTFASECGLTSKPLLISAKAFRYHKAVTVFGYASVFQTLPISKFRTQLSACSLQNLIAMPASQVEETSDVPLQSDASDNTPQESVNQSQCPVDQEARPASSIIVRYLLENVAEFRQLTELRQKVNRSGAETPSRDFRARTLTDIGMEQPRRRSILPKATPQCRQRRREDG